jgi:hypothetical protein
LLQKTIGARDLLICIFVPVIRNRYLSSLLLSIRQYSLLFISYHSLFDYLLHFH